MGLRAAAIAAAALLLPPPAQAAHPHALWHVVHDLCVPDRRLTGLSAPCLEVDLKRGYAVLADPRADRRLVLVPLRRLAGVESRELLEPDAPNWWDLAWAARRHLEARTGPLPRQDVGLAVNSIFSRSQDQLHIHIDCLAPAVRDALVQAQPRLGPDWRPLTLGSHVWRARLLEGETPGANDPFRMAADALPEAAAHRERLTLVLAGAELAEGRPGFVVLAREADPDAGDGGHGEGLLDRRCALASAPRP